MSGHGETPDGGEDDPLDEDFQAVDLALGQTLYTDDGKAVGEVRGIEEGGAFVTFREGAEGLTVEHARSGHEFGKAHLVWRCMECGEMGEIDGGLPKTCPGCGEPKEALMYWTED